MSTVVFFLVPQLHLLDLAGPAQAFSTADGLGLGYRLGYLADSPIVPTAQGLPLQASTSWPALGRDDLVVVPGWKGRTLKGTGQISRAALATIAAHHAAGAPLPASARVPTRSVGPACWTGGAAPRITPTRTSWPSGTPARTWSATCCSPRTTEW